MIKDAMEKNAGTTATDREMAVLKEHFSGCFHGEEFDLEAFARLVGKGAKVVREGYGLSFLGRDYGRLVAARETETVLVPDEAHNAKPENRDSRNLYVTGDNLDALKHLLGSYAGAVKCIYIDPPYNTGSDGFVYNDSFSFTAPELSEKLGVSEEEAARVLDLTHRSSASHSAWLLFLYPRLLLARDLLASDGVIFISIDDNEQANLKLLCDEVFGEENFVACLPTIMNLKGNNDEYAFAGTHEYTLVFTRNKAQTVFNEFEIDNEEELEDWEEDEIGLFKQGANLKATGGNAPREKRPNLYYPIFCTRSGEAYATEDDHPKDPSDVAVYPITAGQEMSWRWGKTRVIRNKLDIIVRESSGEISLYKKQRPSLGDIPSKKPKTTFYKPEYSSGNGTAQIKSLFNAKVFPNPKPVDLISDFLKLATNKDSIVLDFFSGSATTAEAVMRLNAEANGNRRFILVQWPEVCKENSEAQRAGYRTIDEIGRARIEKAAAKIRVESPLFHGDLGFKHYRIAAPTRESVAKMWDFKPDSLVEDSSLLAEFGEATVLATWLAHDGYGLSAEPEEVDFAGYKGRFIGRHLYFTRPGLTDEAVLALCERIETDPAFNPENLVLFGYSFPWSALEHLRINLARSKSLAKNLVVRMDVRY